jgi:hypothetical protein
MLSIGLVSLAVDDSELDAKALQVVTQLSEDRRPRSG